LIILSILEHRSTPKLIHPWLLEYHQSPTVGVNSNACGSAARRTQLSHSGNFSGSLVCSIRFVHAVLLSVASSVLVRLYPVGVSTTRSVNRSRSIVVVHSHSCRKFNSLLPVDPVTTAGAAHPMIDSLVVLRLLTCSLILDSHGC
jgi:hypothetical protein